MKAAARIPRVRVPEDWESAVWVSRFLALCGVLYGGGQMQFGRSVSFQGGVHPVILTVSGLVLGGSFLIRTVGKDEESALAKVPRLMAVEDSGAVPMRQAPRPTPVEFLGRPVTSGQCNAVLVAACAGVAVFSVGWAFLLLLLGSLALSATGIGGAVMRLWRLNRRAGGEL